MSVGSEGRAVSGRSRRDFLKQSGAAALAVTWPDRPRSQAAERSAEAGPAKRFIGIQAGAVSFVDEGVDRVLDILQERGGVNALMLAVFTYGRGIAGRQIPGQPLPDHGVQSYDTGRFHGGDYANVHDRFYSQTTIKDFRAPDVGDFDLLGSVVPEGENARYQELLLV